MDVKQAIAKAKAYVEEVYGEEPVTNLGLEEIEFDEHRRQWLITVAFSRPWNAPKTRTQEVLESMGGLSSLKRSYKVLAITDDGVVLSMKNRARMESAD